MFSLPNVLMPDSKQKGAKEECIYCEFKVDIKTFKLFILSPTLRCIITLIKVKVNIYKIATFCIYLMGKVVIVIKVLLCIRKNYLTDLAGDSIQLITTANYLRENGITADINNGDIVDFAPYDIIHLFNLTRISETYDFFNTAKASKKPIVITPIYWDLSKYYKHNDDIDRLALWDRYKKFRQEILEGCSMIYPSSNAEMELIKNEYGENLPCTVLYNCIKDSFKYDRSKREPFVLCVSRIGARKNQLILSKVCNDIGVKLILVGEANNKEYLKKCLEYENVSYRGFYNQSDLINLYKLAKVHALCSFVETPGLSSLEAAACGCNIVSTIEGSTKEYFGAFAFYCNPYDEKSIYEAVNKALATKNKPKLSKSIRRNFKVDNCLDTLYESYKKVCL